MPRLGLRGDHARKPGRTEKPPDKQSEVIEVRPVANGKNENDMRASLLTLVVVLLSGYAGTAVAQKGSVARDWAPMADEVSQRPELAERLKAVIASARKVAATPIVKRVHHYADIGKDRTWLDGRAKFMDGQPRQEWFGLAMSDYGTSGTILTELPLLAFAYRCTGEEAFARGSSANWRRRPPGRRCSVRAGSFARRRPTRFRLTTWTAVGSRPVRASGASPTRWN